MKRIWLEEILQKKKLTHQEVADLAQIERSYFTQIVNGTRRPSPDVAQRIAKELNFNWTNFFNIKSGETPLKESNDIDGHPSGMRWTG